MRFGTTSSRFRLAHNDEHDKEIKETFAPRVSSDVALGPPLELPPGQPRTSSKSICTDR
jgi:hypothetical protein